MKMRKVYWLVPLILGAAIWAYAIQTDGAKEETAVPVASAADSPMTSKAMGRRRFGRTKITRKTPMAKKVNPRMVMVGCVKTSMKVLSRVTSLGRSWPGSVRPQRASGIVSSGDRL